ncbi:hypothetical protein [Salinibacter ruber]|uniref:hypothetical protein n=1 Tax=Salinibacter ruber TaxID=146919 RepID=UPI00216A6255|nr:hypothetical protein [Salinibacter ruber]MCS4201752.1 hypothetical protein [Salinibacter ruber]
MPTDQDQKRVVFQALCDHLAIDRLSSSKSFQPIEMRGLFRGASSGKHPGRKEPLSGRSFGGGGAYAAIFAHSDYEGDFPLLQHLQETCTRKFSVCNEGSHLPRLHNLEKPIQQIGVFFGTGSATVTQSGSRDWKGDSVLRNPNHEYVYRRLTELPLVSVQNCRIERTGRNEIQKKPTERLGAKGKLGEKPLEAPVGRVDLALRLPRVGQLGKIRGRLHRKRSRWACHQFHRARFHPSRSERTHVSFFTWSNMGLVCSCNRT